MLNNKHPITECSGVNCWRTVLGRELRLWRVLGFDEKAPLWREKAEAVAT